MYFPTPFDIHIILPTPIVGADIIRPYDESGNPVKMGDCDVIWTNGRQLSKIVFKEDGTEMLSYTYDDNGIRTSKTYEGKTTYYTTIDGLITSEYTIDTNGSKINEIDYIYNSADEVIAATYKGKTYYYLKSATGDVVGAADETGRMIGLYQYDAWGNETERFFNTTDADEEHFLSINPMKYRGYYLDYEMEMYYLQSRYYFSHWCRFFNSDLPEYAQQQKNDQVGTNLFAYCCNNPVNNVDPYGSCYYTVDLKWRHDSWENSGGYKKKKAPKIKNYTFPGYYKIKLPNGGRIKFSKSKELKDMPAKVNKVYFLTLKQTKAALAVLTTKGAVKFIKTAIKKYKKSRKKNAKKNNVKALKKAIKDYLIKKVGKKTAETMFSVVNVCSIDTSFVTDLILLASYIKLLKDCVKNKTGAIIYKAKYKASDEVILTLQNTEYVSINQWTSGVVNNPTSSGYKLLQF